MLPRAASPVRAASPTESTDAVAHALAYGQQSLREGMDRLMREAGELRGRLRAVEAAHNAMNLSFADIGFELGCRPVRPEALRTLLAQLVSQQHALPCGDPALSVWREGMPAWRPDPPESDEGEDGEGSR